MSLQAKKAGSERVKKYIDYLPLNIVLGMSFVPYQHPIHILTAVWRPSQTNRVFPIDALDKASIFCGKKELRHMHMWCHAIWSQCLRIPCLFICIDPVGYRVWEERLY